MPPESQRRQSPPVAAASEPVADRRGHRAGPPPAPAPGVLELEDLLSNHLNTRVKVDMGAKRGRVLIDFATLEDLERIYKLMVGGVAGRTDACSTSIPRRVVMPQSARIYQGFLT